MAPTPGEAIGIIGIGTLGCIAVQMARLFSPRAIVAFGLRDEELELARRNGATHMVNVSASDPEEATLEILGDGCDVVIETAGSPAAVHSALRIARIGGRVTLLGLAGAGQMLEVPSDVFVVKDVRIGAALSYTSKVWSKVLGLVSNGLVDLDPIVTHRFKAHDYAAAYSLMEERSESVAKIVLEHAGAA